MYKALLVFVSVFFSCSVLTYSQHSKGYPANGWTIEDISAKSFIENKGQFDGRNNLSSKILYAVDHSSTHIYFTKQGLTYRFDKKARNKDRKKGDRTKPKLLSETDFVHLTWEGANPNALLIGENPAEDYHTYSILSEDRSSVYDIRNIKGYKKLTYKNLYPKIDIEYVFHPETGIKYSLILHPGADASMVKMQYGKERNITIDNSGKLIIATSFGDIIEHAPVTFYANNKNIIPSRFIKTGNTVSFVLDNFDNTKTVIIDPWVQMPTLTNSNAVWECDKDGAGNVYIIGGDMPMKLQKYDAAGALQWTYNTPWDTANFWLGTLATDLAGNSYITAGSSAVIQKVNTSGSMVWNANGGSMDEYWTIVFNCDQTKLIVGGTKLDPLNIANSHGVIFDINTSNGSVTSFANVATVRTYTVFGLPVTEPNEVRSLTSSRNAKYYFLTLDTIGAINQNLTACSSSPLFAINSTYNFSYKSENYRPNNGNSGICAIRANENFVYSQNGTTIHKRSLVTGAVLATASIPGGISTSSGGFNQPGNNGIDIDDCGNVYVGSADRVVKYDANLNVLSSVTTPYKIFDVAVSTNGDIIVCGATGTSASTSRTGYVQSINMSACAPFALTCCDATVCPIGPFCPTDPPITLSPVTSGGTWSGTGITNTSTGTFDPSVAGPGTHTIAYSLMCGVDSITITVYTCATLSVCIEPNGDYTVSGGSTPYTWQFWTPPSSTPITNQTECQNCGYTWFFGSCLDGSTTVTTCNTPGSWTTFATGTTVTTPGTFPIRVYSSPGDTLVITSSSGLLPCSTSCPTITLTNTAQTNVSCFGGNDGSATVSGSGGAGPYTYSWAPSGGNNATATGLLAGAYTVTATDTNGCSGTITVTITEPVAALSSTISNTTDATCGQNDGSATATASGGTTGYTYSWSPSGGTAATANNLAAGTYTITVTDANSCTATATATVANTGAPTANISSQTNVSCNGGNNGEAIVSATGGTSPYTYSWSPSGGTNATASGLIAGTYTVTVTDGLGCITSQSVTITEPSALLLNTSFTPASCGLSDGSATVSVSGGTGTYSYNWSPQGGTTATASNIPADTYTVTVTDANNCTQTAIITVTNSSGTTVNINSQTNVSCNGGNNGEATVSATGGASPYTYSWSPSGDTTATASGLIAGTYFVIVTDDLGCATTDSVTITEPSAIDITSDIAHSFCGSSDGSISVIAAGGIANYTYAWQPGGDTTSTIGNLAGGLYTITVTDNNNCTYSETLTVNTTGGLVTDITPSNATIDQGDSIQITATGGITYSWIPSTGLSCFTCPAPTASPDSTTTYIVTVKDANGCSAKDTITIFVEKKCGELFVPTIFSPNDDGLNDSECVLGNCIASITFAIYDRWGEKIFETNNPKDCWDGTYKGKKMNNGVFVYKLEAILITGENIHKKGNITLVR